MMNTSGIEQTTPESAEAPQYDPRQAHCSAPLPGQREVELLDAEMLDALSADLREPLAIIKGYAETLLLRGDRFTRDERHEFLTAIIDASERFELVLQRCLPSNP